MNIFNFFTKKNNHSNSISDSDDKCLEDIISSGEKISINYDIKYPSFDIKVSKISDNNILIQNAKEIFKSFLKEKNLVRCNYIKNNMLFIIDGIVDYNNNDVLISPVCVNIRETKRKNNRHNINCEGLVSIKELRRNIKCRVLNISLSGVLIEFYDKSIVLKKNCIYSFKFNSNDTYELEFSGYIIRDIYDNEMNSISYGINFSNIESKDIKIINKLITLN